MNIFDSIKSGNLIGRYLAGKESESESSQLKAWLNESNDNRILFEELKKKESIASAVDEFETFNKELAWEKYNNKLSLIAFRKSLFRWKAAAVFLLIIGCAGVIAHFTQSTISEKILAETFTTVSTANGQNSKIVLPDSSVVWINSGTTLSYNTNFAATKRIVKLMGQAYFQVAKNPQMPLVVACNDLNVRVLGTKFDVSSYSNDDLIRVVLESGKVELLNANDQTFIYEMKPNEKAEFDVENKKLMVSDVNAKEFAAWKDGFFVFKNEKMDRVFKRLERLYNIKIEVRDVRVNSLNFNATIVNENIEEIFELIKFSCGINYTIVPSRDPEIPIKVIINDEKII